MLKSPPWLEMIRTRVAVLKKKKKKRNSFKHLRRKKSVQSYYFETGRMLNKTENVIVSDRTDFSSDQTVY